MDQENEVSLLKKAWEISGEDLEEIYNLLTDVEQTILNVLIKERRAMPVKEIRGLLIDDITQYILGKFKEIDVISSKLALGSIKLKPATLKYFRENPSLDMSITRELWEELRKIPKSPPTKRRSEAEKILKKHHIAEIPSFQTIEKILNELAAAGLVIKRTPIMATKIKAVYAANPKLLKNE